MVASSSAGQRWEAWWSAVPSMRSLRRLDGTGMAHCRRSRRGAARSDLVPGILGRSSLITRRWVMARAAGPDVVVLGSRRKARLEAIVRRASAPQALVRRARIVLLAHAGWPNARIAAELGCAAGTVRTWRRRFARGGMPSLSDRPGSGG